MNFGNIPTHPSDVEDHLDEVERILNNKKVICWWSGGIASAVACKIALDLFGKDNCRVVTINTMNEDDDTYRFATDCSFWYGKEIESIGVIGPGKKYESIEDIWYDFESLNVARGAICSSEAKRQVRIDFQRRNDIRYQVFGFDDSEPNRAKNIKKNYPKSNPIFPLLLFMYSKEDCIKIVQDAGIRVPNAYSLGFRNNNCLKTGCVQGGIGYWKKYRDIFPDRFQEMARREHELTNMKGEPVTINKDQSKAAKASGITKVFLVKHPDYPDHKTIDDIKSRGVEPLVECNGFCGTEDK